MKYQKEIIILGTIIVASILLTFIFNNAAPATGKSVSSQVKIIPLNPEQRSKVMQVLTTSEFAKDIPKKSPISLTFFDFVNGERIWQDSFLISDGQLLSNGKPEISLTLHSKYISELNENNLCEVVKKANNNRDLGFYSENSKAKLFIKYAGMLKYRNCFDF